MVSLEVGEHINPVHTDVFVDNLCTHSDAILFSAGLRARGVSRMSTTRTMHSGGSASAHAAMGCSILSAQGSGHVTKSSPGIVIIACSSHAPCYRTPQRGGPPPKSNSTNLSRTILQCFGGYAMPSLAGFTLDLRPTCRSETSVCAVAAQLTQGMTCPLEL